MKKIIMTDGKEFAVEDEEVKLIMENLANINHELALIEMPSGAIINWGKIVYILKKTKKH